MEYEERLICFVDLLGFSAAVKKMAGDPKVAEAMHRILSDFKDGGLEKSLYGSIPVVGENGPLGTCADEFGENLVPEMDRSFGLVATQFSDSFVLSAPANNPGACELLLQALQKIHFQFFFEIGMLMRGGLTIGKVIHERGGALFGPGMIEAYELESKYSVYARVIASKSAEEFIQKDLKIFHTASFFFTSFDGYYACDLVSFLMCSQYVRGNLQKIEGQLEAIKNCILNDFPMAYPKIAYLMDRFGKDRSLFIGTPKERILDAVRSQEAEKSD